LGSSKLDLGKLLRKIGNYEIYENGEVFYRAMEQKHYNRLLNGEGIIGTGETFTSPTLDYIIADGGYGGVIVKFQMKSGTLESLKAKALINDNTDEIKAIFDNNLPRNVKEVSSWTKRDYILFKTETVSTGPNSAIRQVNIGLGNADALKLFNENIINFEKVVK
jgi:hypothetical protein